MPICKGLSTFILLINMAQSLKTHVGETRTLHHVNNRMKFGTAFWGCAFYYLIIEIWKGLCYHGNIKK